MAHLHKYEFIFTIRLSPYTVILPKLFIIIHNCSNTSTYLLNFNLQSCYFGYDVPNKNVISTY